MFYIFVKFLRHHEFHSLRRAVAAREQGTHSDDRGSGESDAALGICFENVSHPFVPPLETPSMIFLWKSRNSKMSGRDTITTAAIMAGMFSRPRPFSRIS